MSSRPGLCHRDSRDSRAGLGGSPPGCAAAAAALTSAPFLTAHFSGWEKDREMPFKSAKLFSWRLVGAVVVE